MPGHLVAEILDGELFIFPRPAFRHARASSILGGSLVNAFDAPPGGGGNPGGWWILDEPELHLREDIVVPDIAGWRRERLPLLPDVAWLGTSPDWVCEVVSPTTESVDRGRKLRVYAQEGVANLWLVNPIARTLESYRLQDSKYPLLNTFVGDETVRAEPFQAVALDMSRCWIPEASD